MNRQLICISTLLFVCAAQAEDIYSWKENGVVHFSTKKTPGAEKAELPQITKESFKPSQLKTCEKHGGINCSAGADADGSVVCLDGFKEAAALFSFTCQSARLEFVDASFDAAAGEYKVFVRNSKAVAAKRVTVIYQEKLFTPAKLTGPNEIAPYETGEFILKNKPGVEFSKPTPKSILLACNNCG